MTSEKLYRLFISKLREMGKIWTSRHKRREEDYEQGSRGSFEWKHGGCSAKGPEKIRSLFTKNLNERKDFIKSKPP